MTQEGSAGKVALVTGASAGIGAALTTEFARRGADVVAVARRLDRLDEVIGRVQGLGRRGLAVGADVRTEGELERAAELALSEFGRIDYVVANAGYAVTGQFAELTLDDYRQQFETNVFGVLRTAYATHLALQESGGVFALVGSVAGEVSFPGTSPYSMSKAAIHRLAESLRVEFEQHGVAVTLIIPGYVESEVRQVDRHGEHHPDMEDTVPSWLVMPAEKAAREMVRAMVHRRAELVLTGHGKVAVALKHHAPWLVHRLVSRSHRRNSR